MNFVSRLKAGRCVQKLKASTPPSPEEIEEVKVRLRELGEDAIRPLLESLGHGVARGPAMDVLESLLSDDTLAVFVEALASPNPAVVSGVTKVLARTKHYQAFPLVELLGDASLPKAALEAVLFEKAKEIPSWRLVEAIPDLPRDSRTVVFRLLERATDESAVEPMVALLEHEDWSVRLYMARLLGEFPRAEVRKGLVKLLRDKNKEVRRQAVKSLHQIKATDSIPELVNALRDGDLKVQSAAIDAVSGLGDASSVNDLLEVLKDQNEYSRRAAVEVLNEIATTEAVQDLVRALRDEDWWVRVRAADALGSLGGDHVVQAVIGLLDDDDDFIRRYAVEILNAVTNEKAVAPLVQALDDPDWWVRERSIDALAKTGDPRAVEPIVGLMERDPGVAALCARALGELGHADAVRPLCRLATSSDEEGRREAVSALRALDSKDLPPELRTALQTVLKQTPASNTPISGGNAPLRVERAGQPMDLESLRNNRAPAKRAPTPSTDGTLTPSSPSATPAPVLNYHHLPSDTILLDRYLVRRRIGQGGFSAVYLVHDQAVQEEMILKILNPQLSTDDVALRRFVQELKVTRRLTHERIIRLYDFLDLGGAHAVSMEYFPGRDLGKVIDAEAPLPTRRVLGIAVQICEGLAAAHAGGVIHRDIKPANVLTGKDDTVKICDFGLASGGQQIGSRLTKSGFLIGTPEYMAPEQISGEEVDHRADIYSLGVLLYEMLCGIQPFAGETPVKVLFQHLEGEAKPLRDMVPGISSEVEELVGWTMARERRARPADANELKTAIENLLATMGAALPEA